MERCTLDGAIETSSKHRRRSSERSADQTPLFMTALSSKIYDGCLNYRPHSKRNNPPRRTWLYLEPIRKGLYLERGLVGAGDENRTHMISLEGWGSTIELRPRISTPQTYDIITKYQMNSEISSFLQKRFRHEIA